MDIDDADSDLLLQLADPLPPGAAALSYDDLPGQLRAQAVLRRRRRRSRWGAGSVGLVAAVAVAVPAAAAFVGGAHTGHQYPSQCVPGTHCEDPTGEVIRAVAPDAGAVYAGHFARYPLPAGQSLDRFLARVTHPRADTPETTTDAVETDVAYESACRWRHAWVAPPATTPGPPPLRSC